MLSEINEEKEDDAKEEVIIENSMAHKTSFNENYINLTYFTPK